MQDDPFAELGLPAMAELTDDDVHAAWRRIAAATHPDREDGGDPALFGAAAAAYVLLKTSFGRGEALADLGGARPAAHARRRRRARVRAGADTGRWHPRRLWQAAFTGRRRGAHRPHAADSPGHVAGRSRHARAPRSGSTRGAGSWPLRGRGNGRGGAGSRGTGGTPGGAGRPREGPAPRIRQRATGGGSRRSGGTVARAAALGAAAAIAIAPDARAIGRAAGALTGYTAPVGACGDGPGGIGDPVGPGPDVQAGLDARQGEGEHLVRRGDAGAAVGGHRAVARRAERAEAHPQVGRRPEGAVRVDVRRRRRADRARYVARHRVHVLRLAPVPLRRPRVEQHPVPAERGGGVRAEQAELTGARAEVTGGGTASHPLHPSHPSYPSRSSRSLARGPVPGARLDRSGRGRPGAEPAVEHPDLGVAEVAQQPPGARRGGRVGVVVHHDELPVAHAGPAHSRLEAGGRRHRVPAAGPRRGGEVLVQVDEGGAGYVPRRVKLAAGRAPEPPADVEQRDRAPGSRSGRPVRPP